MKKRKYQLFMWNIVVLVAILSVIPTSANAQGVPIPYGNPIYQTPQIVVPKENFGNIFQSPQSSESGIERFRNAKPGGTLVLPGYDPGREDSNCSYAYVRDDEGNIWCIRVCGNEDIMRP